MNREEKRRLGLKDWVVILGCWKKAESTLVGVEGSENKDSINQIAVKVLADGPTSAVGLACGTIWENAGEANALAMIVGAQVITMKDWEEMQKNSAVPEEKLDNPAENVDTPIQPSAPQGDADHQ